MIRKMRKSSSDPKRSEHAKALARVRRLQRQLKATGGTGHGVRI